MQPINPVQVVSEFLKSAYGTDIMKELGATNRTIELGTIGDISVTLGKDGFRARNGENEEAATAYDIYDIFVTQSSAETVPDDSALSFTCFVQRRFAEQNQ